ncbi:MgtC/SapB family protein [Roseospira goensis]|uniref:Uncharacterized membrane protein (DUF4010 family) n=1 Tax=Roseospira goensis TaxID=391922 RepID=A0A7W6RZR0_9PROT|nr:DUF4010 domain-containing protein [Roseospira goensis]MBB4285567.1 uncharacterized membrane protein (DUF4010 family) [Roseospira goensis]
MSLTDPFVHLAVALALGLLIGLERGWQGREVPEGGRVAGVRTYALIGLLGGFVGLLARETDIAVTGFAFVGLAAALVAAHVLSALRGGALGITGLVAALLTFAFGAAVPQGLMTEAAVAAVATALLLQYKSTLHRWVAALAPGEVRATLQLLAISVLVLPILPDRGLGPWQALNPFQVWWMVVLIAGISFVGYFAMKIIGPRKGAVLTGLVAGLASSTALTLHFARLARHQPETGGYLASGILLACGTMLPRMVLVTAVVHPPAATALIVPAVGMGVVVYASAALVWWRAARQEGGTAPAPLKNPLALGAAIGFGAVLALVMVAAKGLEATVGDAGVLALAAVSGITDVDAITLTLAKMSADGLALALAGFGIVLAGAVNTVVKGLMALAVGGPALGLRVAVPLALSGAVGLALAAATGLAPGVAGLGGAVSP